MDLEQRLARLERSNRRMKRIGTLVVVVAAAGQPVLHRAVVQHHLAEGADLLQQPKRAEDRRAAHAGGGGDQLLGREVVAQPLDGAQQRAPWARDPVPAAGNTTFEQLA